MTFRYLFNRTRVLGITAVLLALAGTTRPASAQSTGSNIIDPTATAGMPGSILVAEGSLPTSEPVNIPSPSPDPNPATTTTPAPATTAAPESAAHSEPVVSEGSVPDVTTTTPIVDEVVVATPAPLSPSQNVTINLINRLVEKGILTKQDAAELIKQAEADTMVAQQQAAEQQAAAIQGAVAVALQEQAAVMQAQAAPSEPLVMDDTVRVTYVPEVVKKQIREQLKLDVMSQAKAEGWANTGNLPPWVKSIRPFADIRVRYEADFFPEGNDNTGAFPNFNAINTGAPFDVAGNQFSPQLNVDQDRNRMRLRARFGAEADLGENFTAGLRIATGESNSPVSANQSFGYASGQGGQFSKYAIWLDRAFIRYEIGEEAKRNLGLVFGRFDNPFFTVSSIMWDDDIGFDGVALQSNFEVVRGVTPFLNAGAFPIYNTDFNFSSNQPAKFASEDKWLFGAQLGTNWQINKDLNLTVGGSYFYFYNVEGKLSSPYTPLTQNDAGDTDGLRPSFAQKGNTYMALRDIVPDASNDFGAINQWQYFGLATPYQNVAFAGRLNYDRFAPFRVSLSGEFVKNVAFNSSEINGKAVNNRGALDDSLSDDIGAFAGGDTAWTVQLQVGTAGLEKRWDWNVGFGYRYVESDAVIDGFTESDFGGGGTNLKGYVVGGNLALSSNVWVGVRWMSAESIAGPQYKEDVLQFDLNAKF